jgi:hypothetical protein
MGRDSFCQTAPSRRESIPCRAAHAARPFPDLQPYRPSGPVRLFHTLQVARIRFIDIANEERTIPVDRVGAEFVQKIFPAVCDPCMARLAPLSIARPLRPPAPLPARDKNAGLRHCPRRRRKSARMLSSRDRSADSGPYRACAWVAAPLPPSHSGTSARAHPRQNSRPAAGTAPVQPALLMWYVAHHLFFGDLQEHCRRPAHGFLAGAVAVR